MLQTYYKAEIGTADFVNQAEEARESINRWVEEKTNNKIEDLIKDGVLTPLTRLVLTNAVYFKGFWKDQFNKAFTNPRNFKVSKTRMVEVKMMGNTDRYLHGRNEELSCQLLKLLYKGEKMAMVILLPDEIDGLFTLENQVNEEHIRKCDEMMSSRKIEVRLPNFKLDCQLSLKEILSKLGVRDLFDINSADLSGMTDTSELYVSQAVHQAFVDVDEEGTETAAATGVVAAYRSRPQEFLVDHPFPFVIQHCESGAILFQGRVVNPKKSRQSTSFCSN